MLYGIIRWKHHYLFMYLLLLLLSLFWWLSFFFFFSVGFDCFQLLLLFLHPLIKCSLAPASSKPFLNCRAVSPNLNKKKSIMQIKSKAKTIGEECNSKKVKFKTKSTSIVLKSEDFGWACRPSIAFQKKKKHVLSCVRVVPLWPFLRRYIAVNRPYVYSYYVIELPHVL